MSLFKFGATHTQPPATSETGVAMGEKAQPSPQSAHIRDPRFKDFLRELLKYIWPILITAVMLIASASLQLVLPSLTGQMVDSLTAGKVEEVPRLALFAALLTVAAFAIGLLASYILLKRSEQMVYDFRQRLIHQSLNLRAEALDRRSPGDFGSALGNDTAQLRGILNEGVVDVFQLAFTIIATIVLMIRLDSVLFATGAVLAAFTIIVGVWLGVWTRPAAHAVQESVGDMTAKYNQAVIGTRTLRAYRAIPIFTRRILHDAEHARKHGVTVALRSTLTSATTLTISQLALLIILVLGITRISQGHMTGGDLVQFYLYLTAALSSATTLGDISVKLNAAVGAYVRIFHILHEPLEEETVEGTPSQPALESAGDAAASAYDVVTGDSTVAPALSLTHVSFGYHDADGSITPVLNDVSFTVAPRSRTALVGRSGVGKSTILQLIERFYDLDSGQIMIHGQDQAHQTRDEIRSHIAFVEQNPPVFTGSISQNLLLATTEAGTQEQLDALNAVGLPESLGFAADDVAILDHVIGSGAAQLSGGEKQRLAVARALLSDADIVLLDEVTSNLDAVSEHYVNAAIERAMTDKAVIVVSHRLYTVMGSDQIIVLEDGQVTARGTHEELMSTSPLYRDLVNTQTIAA